MVFGSFRALDRVSVSVEEGERLALVGPNGAGKTTLVNVITGYVKPSEGRIVFRGRDVTRLDAWRRVRLGIARSFQLPRLFWKQTVLENVAAAVAARRGLALDMVSMPDEVYEEARRLLVMVGLEDKAHLPVASLSAGERKVLDVLMALALRPKLLLLDEPTSGVATEDKRSVMNAITEAVKRIGSTVVFVEHDIEIVREYASRVTVLIDGRIAIEGRPDEVLEHPLVREHLGVAQ